MSDAWRAGWVIRELKAVPRDDYSWTWLCIIEREATRTVVHVPGVTPDMAIERAWEMAKMVEDATPMPPPVQGGQGASSYEISRCSGPVLFADLEPRRDKDIT